MPQIGIVGIRIAVDARIVVGMVAAREHARRRVIQVDPLVGTVERIVAVTVTASLDDGCELLGRDVRNQALPRDVRDIVRILAARLEHTVVDRLLQGRLACFPSDENARDRVGVVCLKLRKQTTVEVISLLTLR